MALTLFRAGIWLLLLVLAAWVLRDGPLENFAEYLNSEILNRAAIVGVVVLALGVVAMIYEKVTAGPRKHRCKVCGKPVIAGEFYCREHLREIVDRARSS